MKILFFALLLVNVAVFLWPAGEQRSFDTLAGDSSVDNGKGFGGENNREPAINEADLILLSEQTAGASADDRVINGSAQVTSTTVPAAAKTEVASVKESRHCLRIGPFYKEEEKTAAQQFVASFEVPVDAERVDGRVVRSWRAFLGPYSYSDHYIAGMEAAHRAGFTKPRQIAHGTNALIISLGLFSTAKSARQLLEQYRFSDLEIDIREEQRHLPSTTWLEVPTPGVSIYELRMIDRTEWGESQVNVREILCDGLSAL